MGPAALGLPIDLFGTLGLHQRAMDLAKTHALAATYDAHYFAGAEQLDAELWTADHRLFAAVSNALSWVRQAEALRSSGLLAGVRNLRLDPYLPLRLNVNQDPRDVLDPHVHQLFHLIRQPMRLRHR